MFSVALLLLAVSFATAANVEVSPLNLAVGAAIDRMRSSGFLDSNFEQFFGPPAVSVPDDCEKEFPVLADKDSDLYRVLLAQRVRVGVAQVGRLPLARCVVQIVGALHISVEQHRALMPAWAARRTSPRVVSQKRIFVLFFSSSRFCWFACQRADRGRRQ